MKVYDICKLMYSTLNMDCINEILKWVEIHHVQKGFRIWKEKMKNNHKEFFDGETIDKWFINISFFYNRTTLRSNNYIQFINSRHVAKICNNRNCEHISNSTKDYFGITRFPKYYPDFIKGFEFDMIGLYFDHEYSDH